MLGVHRIAIPYLNIVRAKQDSYNGLRDKYKNRIATYDGTDCYTAVSDSCPPVLLAVRTGQELHKDPESGSQTTYDSHNFIELQYSEEIIVNGNDSSAQNVQSSSACAGTAASTAGYTFEGLIKTSGGKVSLGSSDGVTSDRDLNSLYRNFALSLTQGEVAQTHRFRVGLAAFVDESSSANASGCNHWLGYINSENTIIPSGSVSHISTSEGVNSFVKDTAGNSLITEGTANHLIPTGLSVISDSSEDSYESDWSDTLYGSWDLSAPEFAIYRSTFVETGFYEIVGAAATAGTSLNRVEFHLFDNAERDMEGASWYSQRGWTNSSVLYKDYSYAADIFGGSRPFAYTSSSDSGNATSGGIRYSSLYNKASFFKYGLGDVADTAFENTTISGGAVSSVFIAQSGLKRDTGTKDSLYFSVYLPSSSEYSLNTCFILSYDESACVTDLAGNLLKSASLASIDRVAPKFSISSAQVSGDKLYIVFNKAINSGEITMDDNSGVEISGKIGESLRFITIPASGHTFSEADVVSDLYIDTSVDAEVSFQSTKFTGLIFKLNRSVSLSDIKNYYIQCYSPYPGQIKDPVTGFTGANVTFVQDGFNNYMVHGEAHALSDFAVNVVNPSYAYDNRVTDENYNFSIDMYKEESYAVHDWGKNQKNYGRLMTGYDIFLHAVLDDGLESSDDELPEKLVMYLDNSPDLSSVSTEYNKNLKEELRIWIPDYAVDADSVSAVENISALAPSVNSGALSYSAAFDEDDAGQVVFNIDWNTLKDNGYSSGDQVSFLFGINDSLGSPVKICHSPEYNEVSGIYTLNMQPLFALRLKDLSDPTSLDLWSFRLQDISLQRGNVTILNNVIDVNQGENTIVNVTLPSDGNLNVVVLTLDGNVVKYLQHGKTSAGEHNYSWNGTTKSGKKVARGLYFIRVFGNGIDETRKVMVVKN